MRIQIRSRDVDAAMETLRSIERRVRLTVGRHAPTLSAVTISLFPSQPIGGPASYGCRIGVRPIEGVRWCVEGIADDALEAASVAAWRLANRLEHLHSERRPVAGISNEVLLGHLAPRRIRRPRSLPS